MMDTTTDLLREPGVYFAPGDNFSGTFSVRPNAESASRRPSASSGETDLYLRRSHAIVERLRRAVEARAAF